MAVADDQVQTPTQLIICDHLIILLQDTSGQSHLAVIGTDPRGSGHFTYVSEPDLMNVLNFEVQPLKCTNRCEPICDASGIAGCSGYLRSTICISHVVLL